MSNFCESGLWPAVQSLVVFIVTNILTHAASIHLPAGADPRTTTLSIFGAIIAPVALGDNAFHIIGRWSRRMWFHLEHEPSLKAKIKTFFWCAMGGNRMEDAALAGALAIPIPSQFRQLVSRSWDRVLLGQRIVSPCRLGYADTRVNCVNKRLTLKAYVPVISHVDDHHYYILPPTTTFKTDVRYLVIPSSNILPQLIAIIQLFLSSRQLYLNYNSSIKTRGLASPYLVVVPYVVMTLVNFVANAVVGSYSQVVILPADDQPEENTQPKQQPASSSAIVEEPKTEPTETIDLEATGTATDPFKSLRQFMKLYKITDAERDEFVEWLKQYYSFINADEFSLPPRRRMSSFASSMFLVPLVTLIVGLLTHFHVGVGSRAGWFLVWLYGMPIIGFLRPFIHTVRETMTWLVILIFLLIFYLVIIGVFGGTAVICVGLLESMCSSEWSFSVDLWVKIGFTTFFVVGFIEVAICAIFGISRKCQILTPTDF